MTKQELRMQLLQDTLEFSKTRYIQTIPATETRQKFYAKGSQPRYFKYSTPTPRMGCSWDSYPMQKEFPRDEVS